MKDEHSKLTDIYYELMNLDVEIDHMKNNVIKYANPFSDEFKKIIKEYNALCKRRLELQEYEIQI